MPGAPPTLTHSDLESVPNRKPEIGEEFIIMMRMFKRLLRNGSKPRVIGVWYI
jgi:hypothetical protein